MIVHRSEVLVFFVSVVASITTYMMYSDPLLSILVMVLGMLSILVMLAYKILSYVIAFHREISPSVVLTRELLKRVGVV